MSDSVISMQGLGKKYVLSHVGQTGQHRYKALRDVIADKFKFFRGSRAGTPAVTAEEFWALRDVSFDIKQGERVGIIGRNGAGKSTLLKILSRITEPTEGRIAITGTVASLLEVGTGFHPELTGRENIFLNGAILGMPRAEIRRKFDEIVAFAEVEKFLDTPVKRYSSGMYVRLAFAVAAHLEPEILIVDEVLAVGDAEFQKKCLGKMEEVAKGGRTVLFVSHNMQSISALTGRALLLDRGRIVAQGATSEVITHYLERKEQSASAYAAPPSEEHPNITRVEVVTSEPAQVQVCREKIEFRFEVWTPCAVRGASFSFQVIDAQMQRVVHMWTFDSETPMCRSRGRYTLTCTIPVCRLYMGRYTLTAYFSEPPGGDVFEVLESVCPFEVVMYGMHREFPWRPGTCTYLEDGQWSIGKSSES